MIMCLQNQLNVAKAKFNSFEFNSTGRKKKNDKSRFQLFYEKFSFIEK